MIDTKELDLIKTEVSTLETSANALVIENADQYKVAVDLVSKLKTTGANITKRKETITKPLNEALRSARALFSPIETMFENAENIIKQKLLVYKQKVDEEARRKEAEIAAKAAAGKIQLKTAERRMEKIERVETTTKTEVGAVQIKKIKKVRIVDEKLIPRAYLVPDMVTIRRIALGGIVIPGVEVYTEETVSTETF